MVMDVGNVTTLDDASFHRMDILMFSSMLVELGHHFVMYKMVCAAGTFARTGCCYKTNV
jgi:hypothetical protein